jgi:hypothetical protein
MKTRPVKKENGVCITAGKSCQEHFCGAFFAGGERKIDTGGKDTPFASRYLCDLAVLCVRRLV